MKLFVSVAGLSLALANEGPVPVAVERLRAAQTSEIFSLLSTVLPDLKDSIPSNGLKNYGCTGVGNMDPYLKNYGRPIDKIDNALNNRKKCIHCASSELGADYSTYQFDENKYCVDALGTAERAFCECDLNFANTLDTIRNSWDKKNNGENMDTSLCTPGYGSAPLCCEGPNGLFSRYNSNAFECCNGEVVEIGICLDTTAPPTTTAAPGTNECENGTHNCNTHETCIDTDDSFTCICTGSSGARRKRRSIEGLIPNPSFEDSSCCPTFFSKLTCADTWVQASAATSDYWHTCGFSSYHSLTSVSFPLPGQPGGQGWAGFITGYPGNPTYNEMVGACLTSPMLSGNLYVMNMWMAKADGNPNLEFTVYGTTTCSDLPWSGMDCPIGVGSWEVLGSTSVSFATEGDWYEVTVSFTLTKDIYAVALGGDCTTPQVPKGDTYNYYMVDELTLADSEEFKC